MVRARRNWATLKRGPECRVLTKGNRSADTAAKSYPFVGSLKYALRVSGRTSKVQLRCLSSATSMVGEGGKVGCSCRGAGYQGRPRLAKDSPSAWANQSPVAKTSSFQHAHSPTSCRLASGQLPAVGPRYAVFAMPTTNYFPSRETQARLSPSHVKKAPSRSAPCASTTTVKMSTAELATSYAALILADDGVEITVRKPTSER